MGPDAIASAVAAIATGGFAAWGARSARRTRRQENRDDFTAVVKELRTDVKDLRAELGVQKQESKDQRQRLAGQDFAIRYLVSWVRSLVGYIRAQRLEPPAPPQPVPPEVQAYLNDIGV